MQVNLYPADAGEEDFQVITAYLRYLREAHPEIRAHVLEFLTDLLLHTSVTTTNMDAILRGAFTVVHGDRCFMRDKYAKYQYRKTNWVNMSSHGKHLEGAYRIGAGSMAACSGKTRVHCEAKDQKHAADAVNHTFDILVGCHIATGDTAFQFEKVRIDTGFNTVRHIGAFLKYATKKKKRRRNIGAFGTSSHLDTKPLVLKPCMEAPAGRPCHKFGSQLVTPSADFPLFGAGDLLAFMPPLFRE